MSQYTLTNYQSGGIVCPTCGEDGFDTESGMRIHHSKVHGESLAGVEVKCGWCEETVRVKESRAQSTINVFCSDLCESAWRKQRYSGSLNPQSKRKVTLSCEICGRSFEEHKSSADSRKTCSEKCAREWFSRTLSGENHYNWSGGAPDYYGPNWKRQRRKARRRDEYQCQDCGNGENLHVHHITPIREFEEFQKANDLENLVTLCEQCHQDRHK